jgi:hypothetical protein
MSNDQATDDRKAIGHKRLYHFTHADFALEDIKYRRLKIAEFKDMNDPFELGCFKLPTREHRDAMKGIKKEFSEKCGLLCFSEDWENPLLWSHYADKHRGICLGFDVDLRGLCRVSYKEERPDFPNASTDEFANQLYSTKYKGWEYEREWRGSFEVGDRENGLHFHYFGSEEPMVLREVIVGMNCKTTEENVRAVLGDYPTHVEIIKARLAFNTFRVVKKQDGFAKC